MVSDVRDYLSSIGRIGGKKCRRKLDSITAKNMVRVREARRAFKRFYALCFWSFDPNYNITLDDVDWVAEKLKTFGGREGWELGSKLCP